jgi:hypothetical protein
MTEADVENELQNLKAQIALLEKEHAKTRGGWLRCMQAIGLFLIAIGLAAFIGVLRSHASIESNPVAMSIGLMSIFMIAPGLLLLAFSTRWLAEKIMKAAVRR